MLLQILGSILVLLVFGRLSKYWASAEATALNTHICLFQPVTFPAIFSPFSSWRSFDMNWTWNFRMSSFSRLGETFNAVPLFYGKTTVWTADPHIAKQVLNVKSTFYKSRQTMRGMNFWGKNILSSNWELWKRQRRLVEPVFNISTYVMVWKETRRFYYEMVTEEGWRQSSTPILIENINEQTSKITLLVISKSGLGLETHWKEKDTGPEMSFGQAIVKFSALIATLVMLPRWVYKLPLRFIREVEAAHHRLDFLMRSYVKREGRNLEDTNGPKDLLTILVEAGDSGGGLTPEEVISNVFIFMFAGHETTARTIAACLALLAIYPEEQDIALKEIKTTLAEVREPTVDDIPELTHITACFYEAARLFPAVIFFTRDCEAQEVLAQRDGDFFILPANSRVYIDNVRIQYNPRLFPNPYEFKPSRWYRKQDHDLTFFGFGPRSCPGRKFALTEGVCFLTHFLRDWVVEVDLKGGETREEWRERVMRAECLGLGFGVNVIPLKIRKREG